MKKILLAIIIVSSTINLNAEEKVPGIVKEGETYKIVFGPMVSKKLTIITIDKKSGWVKVNSLEKGVKEEWVNLNQALVIQILEEKDK